MGGARTHLRGFHWPHSDSGAVFPPLTPPSLLIYFSTDDLEFRLGFPLTFRLFSWGNKIFCFVVSVSRPIITPFSVMIDTFWNIRRNGVSTASESRAEPATSCTPAEEGEARLRAATSLCPSGLGEISSSQLLCHPPHLFLSLNQAGVSFLRGQNEKRQVAVD